MIFSFSFLTLLLEIPEFRIEVGWVLLDGRGKKSCEGFITELLFICFMDSDLVRC